MINSYLDIERSICENVVIVHRDEDQGQTTVLFYDGVRYGYLNYSWGSCSGCDALEACESERQRDSLAADMKDRVEWMSLDDVKKKRKEFAESDQIDKDWDGHSGEFWEKFDEWLLKAGACWASWRGQ